MLRPITFGQSATLHNTNTLKRTRQRQNLAPKSIPVPIKRTPVESKIAKPVISKTTLATTTAAAFVLLTGYIYSNRANSPVDRNASTLPVNPQRQPVTSTKSISPSKKPVRSSQVFTLGQSQDQSQARPNTKSQPRSADSMLKLRKDILMGPRQIVRKLLNHNVPVLCYSINNQGATIMFDPTHPIFKNRNFFNLSNFDIQNIFDDPKLRMASRKDWLAGLDDHECILESNKRLAEAKRIFEKLDQLGLMPAKFKTQKDNIQLVIRDYRFNASGPMHYDLLGAKWEPMQ